MKKILESLVGNEESKLLQDVKMMSPLALAYVGDALFEVFIRNYLVSRSNKSVHRYHQEATQYVKAKAQAEIVHALESELTEEEWGIVKKGRNQKPGTVPKNANLIDYKYATGFEALLGYLFYKGDIERLLETMEKSVDVLSRSEKNE